jgi:predicted dehydrogenase
VLLHFSNGAHGVVWASQVCIGQSSSLKVMIYGDKGGIEWQLDHPNLLTLHTLTGPTQIFHTGGPGVQAGNLPVFPIPRGQTECFLVALTTLYHAFANRLESLADGKTDGAIDYPTVDDGIQAMSFVDAVVRNVKPDNTGKWTTLTV